MTNQEYLIEKNKIVYKHIHKTLIPENQIVDIPITRLMVKNMEEYVYTLDGLPADLYENPLSISNCTYCAEFNKYGQHCRNCPMDNHNNNCNHSEESTFMDCYIIVKQMPLKDVQKLADDLVLLAKKFIKSNKHILVKSK